jgi:hypothetical protein
VTGDPVTFNVLDVIVIDLTVPLPMLIGASVTFVSLPNVSTAMIGIWLLDPYVPCKTPEGFNSIPIVPDLVIGTLVIVKAFEVTLTEVTVPPNELLLINITKVALEFPSLPPA